MEDCAELEDFAPDPGHWQAFPVVAPLSDKKLGPQDCRPHGEVHPRLKEDERKRDEWTFKRDRALGAIARHQRLVHGHRLKAEEAERDLFAAEARAAQRTVDIEAAADDRRRRCNDAERELEMRIEEAIKRCGEAERETTDCIAEAEALVINEQAHTSQVEALLKQERLKSQAAWRRAEEEEAQSRARLEARDREVEQERVEAQRRVEIARKAAEERLRQAEERYAAEVRIMRDQLEAAKARCQERVELEVRRKGRVEEEARSRRGAAAQRQDLESQRMRTALADQRESCREQVGKVEKREAETKDFVERWKVGAVSDLFSAAAKRSQSAHRQEVLSTQSLEHAVHTLGQHYSTQRQYNTTVDSKVSSILQGCLHGRTAVPGSPSMPFTARSPLASGPGGRAALGCPSPRSLPPPTARPRY